MKTFFTFFLVIARAAGRGVAAVGCFAAAFRLLFNRCAPGQALPTAPPRLKTRRFALAGVLLVLAGGLGFAQSDDSHQYTLEEATQAASQDLIQKIPARSSVGVVNVRSLSVDMSLHIMSLLETGLVNTERLAIVSRQKIDVALDEQYFAENGYVDDEAAIRIGHLLGAKYVMTGELTKPEDQYFLNIQVLETETGRLVYSKNFTIENDELKKYEELVAARERLAYVEREIEIKGQERLLLQEIDQITALERRHRWDKFLSSLLSLFGNWTPVPPVSFMAGYNYTPDLPLGFTLGSYGFYTSWNFDVPDHYQKEPPEDTGDPRVHFEFEWVLGYAVNLFNDYLMMPLGIGANHMAEWPSPDSGRVIDGNEDPPETAPWNSQIVLEAGLQVAFKHVTVFGTYRLTDFTKSSFTLGAGAIFFYK